MNFSTAKNNDSDQMTTKKKMQKENHRMLRLFFGVVVLCSKLPVYFSSLLRRWRFFPSARQIDPNIYAIHFDTEHTLCFVCHQAYIMSETFKIARWLWSGPVCVSVCICVCVKHGFVSFSSSTVCPCKRNCVEEALELFTTSSGVHVSWPCIF